MAACKVDDGRSSNNLNAPPPHYQQHLDAEYRVERAPIKVRIAHREFVRLDYLSAIAGPVCRKDFATPDAVPEREEPVFSQLRFNFLSAFPEQAKSISDALPQWQFKPYLLSGQPEGVETGLLFGRSAHTSTADSN